ncbi:hypothetical protein FKP32DRAFT_716025 [Trametes sanguinea]|nr:hypothetical protein FKP32DRAFT_716025 [Trametes sanguinea]
MLPPNAPPLPSSAVRPRRIRPAALPLSTQSLTASPCPIISLLPGTAQTRPALPQTRDAPLSAIAPRGRAEFDHQPQRYQSPAIQRRARFAATQAHHPAQKRMKARSKCVFARTTAADDVMNEHSAEGEGKTFICRAICPPDLARPPPSIECASPRFAGGDLRLLSLRPSCHLSPALLWRSPCSHNNATANARSYPSFIVSDSHAPGHLGLYIGVVHLLSGAIVRSTLLPCCRTSHLNGRGCQVPKCVKHQDKFVCQ